ncbi:MAG: 2-hydroxyacid dehydrogenase [Devosia sp.]
MSEAAVPSAHRPKVLYLSHGPDALYEVMRQRAEPQLDLMTLTQDCDSERLSLIGRADAVIVAAYPLTGPMIERAAGLRFVHHQGVGYQDTIDLDALGRRGARLAITPTGTTTGVAEHTVLLALAVLRRLPFADAELRQGRFHVNALRPQSRELAGKTIGYIGMGRIGQEAARRFRAFDTEGLYHDPAVTLPAGEEKRLGLTAAPLAEVIGSADVLTLHIPSTPATRHLINQDKLALMKPTAILINTARGPVVDETALAEALAKGQIAGAGLDVFENEPPDPSSPLMAMHNTVLTPHISAGTLDAFATKMDAVFANLHRFFKGEPIENEIHL